MDSLSGQMSNLNFESTAATTRQDGAQNFFFRKANAFMESSETTLGSSVLASRVPALEIQDEDDLASSDVSQVCSLYSRATRLAERTQLMNDTCKTIKKTAGRSAIHRLVALEWQSRVIKRLLDSYQTILVRIAMQVLDSWYGTSELLLAQIAEACYTATESKGELDAHSCIDKFNLTESEIRSWPTFWRKILSKCPHGSTLFDTQALQDRMPPGHSLTNVPQYLFRIFDGNSRGRNNQNEVASDASATMVHQARVDVLSSNDDDEATKMLFKHLKWRRFPCYETLDNFSSWTSSLLVAIQYAIYRCQKNNTPPSDIKICVVDTTDFPRGQFARDLDLIRIYNNTWTTYDTSFVNDFFDFRLTNETYQNGEYLSQGLVTLARRSCVAYLAELGDSGLYKLYPEFTYQQSPITWANRIKELRELWSGMQVMSDEELRIASRIARLCFPPNFSDSMYSMLLSFKNCMGQYAATHEAHESHEPIEVRRFTALTHSSK